MTGLLSRRGIVGGLASLLAAPAIVRASSLMPVKPVGIISPMDEWLKNNGWIELRKWRIHLGDPIFEVTEQDIKQATEQDIKWVAQAV